MADLELNDGVLNGSSEEYVTREWMKKPAILTGFIEGNVISFIKQYPFYYSTDENLEIKVDFSKAHPPVHYSGLYDPVSGVLSGDWEIEVFLDRNMYGSDPFLVVGTWELRKVG